MLPEPLPQVAGLLEKLSTERQDLLNVLAVLSDEQAQEHPKGEWSAKQQMAHLVEGEPEWLGWALSVYHRPGITVGQPPEVEQPFLREVADADSLPLTWWLRRLGETRAHTLRRIDETNLSTADAINRRGVHRTWGEMTVLQLLRGIYRHDRMHRDQLLGQEQSFTPRLDASHTPQLCKVAKPPIGQWT
ncbi:MAG: DinB family protein [Dehalococcoidia bacterium]|nr:DinB family protein [Dehalococcoidia bacterium]